MPKSCGLLAMVVNDDAGRLMPRGAWGTIASMLAPTGGVACPNHAVHTGPVGASLLAMVVNDDAGHLISRGAWATIASKLAPTEVVARPNHAVHTGPVGASLLAMVVNDDAGCLMPRGAWATIASMLSPKCPGTLAEQFIGWSRRLSWLVCPSPGFRRWPLV